MMEAGASGAAEAALGVAVARFVGVTPLAAPMAEPGLDSGVGPPSGVAGTKRLTIFSGAFLALKALILSLQSAALGVPEMTSRTSGVDRLSMAWANWLKGTTEPSANSQTLPEYWENHEVNSLSFLTVTVVPLV